MFKTSPVQSVLPIYSLEQEGQTPSGQPLPNPSLSPSPHINKGINGEELYFSIFITVFKNSLQWLPAWAVSFLGGGSATEASNISFTVIDESAIINTTVREASIHCNKRSKNGWMDEFSTRMRDIKKKSIKKKSKHSEY